MKLALAAEGEWELGSLLDDPDASDSTGRILVERIVAGTYPAKGCNWYALKNAGGEVREHRRARGERYTAGLMYQLAVRAGCDGLVLLRDTDADDERPTLNRLGLADATGSGQVIPAVLGMQIRTLEAWLLSDASAFATTLRKSRPGLPRAPEELWGKVGDPTSNHPKAVLGRIVRELGGRCDRHLAARLAAVADLDVMAAACPLGFGAFKRDLELAFRPFDCVVAADQFNGIGRDGDLPWPKLKGDLRFLRETTSAAPDGKRNAVIMGRKTWDSVPPTFRPLPGRQNVVISRRALERGADALVASSLDDALTRASLQSDVDRLFVLGGGEIYRQAFAHPRCRDVYLTRVEATFDCDTFIPALEADFALVEAIAAHHDAGVDYRIERWRRKARRAG